MGSEMCIRDRSCFFLDSCGDWEYDFPYYYNGDRTCNGLLGVFYRTSYAKTEEGKQETVALVRRNYVCSNTGICFSVLYK